MSWEEISVHPHVKEAISALGWQAPTPVQFAAIPSILGGKDVAVESRTGSGKTAAFAIPVANRLVLERARCGRSSGPKALVLVPSPELCQQTCEVLSKLCRFLQPRPDIRNLATQQKSSLDGEVLVATPATLAKAILSQPADALASIRMLVIDEADFVSSLKSMSIVRSRLPTSTLQTILLSATLNESVQALKGQLMHSPVSITVGTAPSAAADESAFGGATARVEVAEDGIAGGVKQHYLVSSDQYSPHAMLYALFRINLISGKSLIFVDNERDTYKLQHFLEQLGVATIAYDATLPLNSRIELLRRFQKNSSGTLICTDATLERAAALGSVKDKTGDHKKDGSGSDSDDAEASETRRERVSGLGRGIDFNKVDNVILFDGVDGSIESFKQYTHRIGRTGRGGMQGLSIVFLTPGQARDHLGRLKDYSREATGHELRPFKRLDRTKAAAFQYRVNTALSVVTRNASRKLRVATVASEMAKSNYLASHLGSSDTSALKRIVGRIQHKVETNKELTDVPSYMDIKEADSVEDYRTRVKANHRFNREKVFESLTGKRQRNDPLLEVVRKVRKSERSERKAEAAEEAQ